MRIGQNADAGDANPYAGKSPVPAQLWMRGYMTMLTVSYQLHDVAVALPRGADRSRIVSG
ncbi:ribosome modulation factor [Mycolicibacter virginiensis]|uniref:ribosome modulation factor n=1 Tax=Mycolicibacter virginiensis TaxID=1795032 RepID=UPI001F036699|nr:hypothetical protein [Mycolicibacter virginiensis]ULP49234.1 hypothetical protein MJO54_09405 [Mycolicibacter virginiensis]